jgi:uncharacterized membrane protein YkvA (DUF1232 family)
VIKQLKKREDADMYDIEKTNTETFDDGAFWDKIRVFAGKIPFAKDVVAMWFAMKDPATPVWAKAAIAGALIYFVSPVDAIPDFLPGGFLDDAGVIAACLATVEMYVTDTHRNSAENFFK